MGESGVKRQQWGLQQRLLSSDLNDISNLSARALIEAIWAMSFGDAYRSVAAGVGGVVGGYTVQAVAGTMNITVSPGIALIPQAPADAGTDSNMVLVQADAAETIDLSAYVDPAFPRLVTIEIDGSAFSFATENRDKINPVTGAYTVVPFDVVVGYEVNYYVNAGVASAAPVLAAGVPGRIPIAIVKLATGMANFTDPYISVLWCRPLLAAMGDQLAMRGMAQGGGLSVGNETGGGAFANTARIDLGDARVELDGLPARAFGRAEFGINSRTPNTTTPAALIGSPQAVYAYAAPPPWAVDYGDLAPRECRTRNPNNINIYTDPQAVVFGDGTTFLSLTYATSPTFQVLENCIVIYDNQPPAGLSYGNSGGAPVRVDDLRGPHPTTFAGGTITLDATQDVTWGATQEVADSVYLGSVGSLGIIPNQFMSQAYQGAGRVRAIDEAVLAGTTYRPTRQYTVSTGILDAFYPGRYPGMLVGDVEILPDYALHLELSGTLSVGAGPGAARLQIASEYGYGAQQISPALNGFWTARFASGDLPNSEFGSEVVPIERDASGRASIYFQGGVGIASAVVVLTGYIDPILAAR
jgi:hypothetical protein